MKASVTDGQLGQLARRQHDLFERVKKGVYENFNEVLDAVQAIIEGKTPVIPMLATIAKLTKWRSFMIGGSKKTLLLQRLQATFSVGDWARDLMGRDAFTTLSEKELIDTIILTPADFGYEEMPTTADLLDPTRLAEWSKQNAERLDGHVVELLPAEAGPHIREQYLDQPNGEILWIAMERIVDSDGGPRVFRVGRDGGGGLWLSTFWTDPDDQWGLGGRVVFRLRKVTQD